ncbi:hypothetical protein AB0L65_60495 [Nonomuraea sp. NPDC052116]|uniref:hypothetical protein n=1 Tax=Nonomuraea sp. NPDC052116 TaxID=3155665 RepID=UPI0034196259
MEDDTEDDRRVWPPQPAPRHRRTPPRYAWGAPHEEEPRRGRTGPLEAVPDPDPEPVRRHARSSGPEPVRGEPDPLDLGPEEPWNPQIRRTASYGLDREFEPWESLPPSARLYGSPADPGRRTGVSGRTMRRWVVVSVALLAGVGLVAGATVVVLRVTAPSAESGQLSDSLAKVSVALPQGWSQEPVPPVTGFTSVARDGDGGLVMARPVTGAVADAKKATAEAAELYSRLLLKGDRVTVVEDKELPGGHTRALRAEYQDVVNRPAFLRVTLLTRAGSAVMLLGLLQPEETARRQALDTVMTKIK